MTPGAESREGKTSQGDRESRTQCSWVGQYEDQDVPTWDPDRDGDKGMLWSEKGCHQERLVWGLCDPLVRLWTDFLSTSVHGHLYPGVQHTAVGHTAECVPAHL